MKKLNEEFLDSIFPPEKADEFFDVLYGDAEDGAYDIKLRALEEKPDEARLEFRLLKRPGKCLKCSLTYGLPKVFDRHPVINLRGVASAVGDALGFGEQIDWELGSVVEKSDEEHAIPLVIRRKS